MTKTALRSLGAAAILASALLAASCILLENPEGEEPGWRTIPERGVRPAEEFRKTLPFASGGTLSLENDYGEVSITGWDREEVEIVARAATVEQQPEASSRPYRIRKVTPEVEVQETAAGGLLIRTPTYEGPGDAPAVDYDIPVPNPIALSGPRMSEGPLPIADGSGRT